LASLYVITSGSPEGIFQWIILVSKHSITGYGSKLQTLALYLFKQPTLGGRMLPFSLFANS
jgi:hypothetical protein